MQLSGAESNLGELWLAAEQVSVNSVRKSQEEDIGAWPGFRWTVILPAPLERSFQDQAGVNFVYFMAHNIWTKFEEKIDYVNGLFRCDGK